MSEIQSIANGTYMIGETTQTELQAGPGISITKPSEGTVRIASDETVLYEDNSTNTFPLTLQLSETLSNFQFVKIEYAGNPYDRVSPTQIVEFNTNSSIFVLQGSHWNSSAQTLWEDVAAFSVNQSKTELSKIKSFYRQIVAGSSPSWTDSQAYFKIFKVVGINRISGGNA